MRHPDAIRLPDLPLKAWLPHYAWSARQAELKQQPLTVSIELQTDLSPAGTTDDLAASVSYSDLTKIAQKLVKEDSKFERGIRQVAAELLAAVEAHSLPALKHAFTTVVTVQQPKALFQADHVAVQLSQTARASFERSEVVSLCNFRVDSLIGVNDYERQARQPLFVDLHAELLPSADWAPREVANAINAHNGVCEPLLIETYLETLAQHCLSTLPFLNVKIAVRKPFATKFAGPPQVSVSRRRNDAPTHALLPLSSSKTTVMGIINLTPDSFGTPPSTLETSLQDAEAQVRAGAHVLDLGGMSTRPGADDVSEAEELRRVVPFVRAVRATEWGKAVPLSIDTFRAEVARQALEAGASWINDVKAGAHGSNGEMWRVAAESGAPIILMHSRGNSKSMNALVEYEGDPVRVVEQELLARVKEALAHGVRKWQIIVDPGIGFAKDAGTNWELLRRLDEYTRRGPLAEYPCLVGTSRKRFLGALVDQPDPFKRDVATAATCVEAIRAGAQIVRVHNPALIIDAVKVADELYRR